MQDLTGAPGEEKVICNIKQMWRQVTVECLKTIQFGVTTIYKKIIKLRNKSNVVKNYLIHLPDQTVIICCSGLWRSGPMRYRSTQPAAKSVQFTIAGRTLTYMLTKLVYIYIVRKSVQDHTVITNAFMFI